MRGFEHAARHLGHAAELARQRPFGTLASAQDAAEHLGPRRHAGDFLDLGFAIHREQADAEREGTRDVPLLLDGVAERDAVGRGAGGQHLLDLDHRGGVEAGAEPGQQVQHFRGRVGLHGIEHARVGERLGKGAVIVAHHVEVDHEARAVFATIAQELENTIGHGGIPSGAVSRDRSEQERGPAATRRRWRAMETRPRTKRCQPRPIGTAPHGEAVWRRATDQMLRRWLCVPRGSRRAFGIAIDWKGEIPVRTPGKIDKPLRSRPLEGRQRRKSPVRRCFKSRPPFGGVRRFHLRLPV